MGNLSLRNNSNHLEVDFTSPHLLFSRQHFSPNPTNFARKSFLYSSVISLLAALHFYSIIKILIDLNDESAASRYSVVTLAFVSVWDCYLCIAHFLMAI